MSIETENPKLLPMITSFGLFFVGWSMWEFCLFTMKTNKIVTD
jgi:hypothetical protein